MKVDLENLMGDYEKILNSFLGKIFNPKSGPGPLNDIYSQSSVGVREIILGEVSYVGHL